MERRDIPTSPIERKAYFDGIVNEALGEMVTSGSIDSYRLIIPEVYPNDTSKFIPSFIFVHKNKQFGLFVSGDESEFREMGEITEDDSFVLNVFKRERIIRPDEIVSVLESRLKRSKKLKN